MESVSFGRVLILHYTTSSIISSACAQGKSGGRDPTQIDLLLVSNFLFGPVSYSLVYGKESKTNKMIWKGFRQTRL